MSEGAGGVGRSIGAVLAGVVVAVLCMMGIEYLGHKVYPPPPGLDPTNMESVRAVMKDIPLGALLFVLAAWVIGTVAGGAVAARIASRKPELHAIVVGLIILALTVVNLMMIPQPTWFVIVSLLAAVPAAYAGALAVRRT
jgi:hypothetical protein